LCPFIWANIAKITSCPLLWAIFITFTINFYVMKKDISSEHQQILLLIGKKVRELRIKRKISYEKMAEEIGIARNTYNLLEQGKISFQFNTFLQVLKYHNILLSEFFKDI
jgi:DNA-binding XRE family transcriptional regulator